MTRIDEENSKPEKITKKDEKILDLIRENSKLSYKKIAKNIQLSHDAVAYRVKRMEDLGIISSYTLDINYFLLGYNRYIIFLQTSESPQKKQLYKFLKGIPEIVNVVFYTDKWDLKLEILSKNSKELDEIITKINTNFSSVILDLEIMEQIKDILEKKETIKKQEIKVDEKDREIINLLIKDSKKSFVEISKKVSLNADSVAYRLKRNKEKGIINSFKTNVNVNKKGYHWYDLLLIVKAMTKDEENKLRTMAKKDKRIIEATKTLGEWNVLLSILAKNAKEFHKIASSVNENFRGNIKDYDALLAYKELKNDPLSV